MEGIIKKYGYTTLNSGSDYIRKQGSLIVRIRTMELSGNGFHPRIYAWLFDKTHGKLDDLCFDIKSSIKTPVTENALKDALNRIDTYASLFV